jgi:hypothetical protein
VSGKSLQGNCSQFRGKLCPWSDLLLTSGDSDMRMIPTVLSDEVIAREDGVVVEKAHVHAPSVDIKPSEKSQKLLSLLRKSEIVPTAAATSSPSTATATATAEAAVNDMADVAMNAEFIDSVAQPVPVIKPVDEPPIIVSAAAASTAMITALRRSATTTSALDKKRMKLEAALKAVHDDEVREEKDDQIASTEPTIFQSQVAKSDHDETVSNAVPDAAVDKIVAQTEKLSVAPETRTKGRSILAAAAGVQGDRSTSLLPPSAESAIAHFPWMTIASYPTMGHIQDLQIPIAPPQPPQPQAKPIDRQSRSHPKKVVAPPPQQRQFKKEEVAGKSSQTSQPALQNAQQTASHKSTQLLSILRNPKQVPATSTGTGAEPTNTGTPSVTASSTTTDVVVVAEPAVINEQSSEATTGKKKSILAKAKEAMKSKQQKPKPVDGKCEVEAPVDIIA